MCRNANWHSVAGSLIRRGRAIDVLRRITSIVNNNDTHQPRVAALRLRQRRPAPARVLPRRLNAAASVKKPQSTDATAAAPRAHLAASGYVTDSRAN